MRRRPPRPTLTDTRFPYTTLFRSHCMAMMLSGNHNILISNPRDLPAMIKDLSKYRFSGFVGLNTLFVALCNSEDFRKLDFSALKVTLSGGMALQQIGRAHV